jgi:hypothetical protein
MEERGAAGGRSAALAMLLLRSAAPPVDLLSMVAALSSADASRLLMRAERMSLNILTVSVPNALLNDVQEAPLFLTQRGALDE